MSKQTYTDLDFIQAVKDSFSVRNVLKILNLNPAGSNYKKFYSKVQNLNINIDHFTGQGYLKNKINTWAPKQDMSIILIKNSKYTNTNHLRQRLIKEKYFIEECCSCNRTTWLGQPISLELDHINGINTDNRIDNLRLLCPNCHSQTNTYRGKNIGADKGT